MAKYKTGQMKRTLQTLRKCASLPKSRPANQRLGVQNAPILTLDPERVVIDELHLRLRIGDVLVRNLVWEIVDSEGADLSLLESCIRQQCSVSFRVWEARDPEVWLDITPGWRYEEAYQSIATALQLFAKEWDLPNYGQHLEGNVIPLILFW